MIHRFNRRATPWGKLPGSLSRTWDHSEFASARSSKARPTAYATPNLFAGAALGTEQYATPSSGSDRPSPTPQTQVRAWEILQDSRTATGIYCGQRTDEKDQADKLAS